MRSIIASLLFAGLASMAMADDLSDAAALCAPHRKVKGTWGTSPHPVPDVYETGWEHCDKIVRAADIAKKAADALDESKNPDLAMTRAIAKGLPQ